MKFTLCGCEIGIIFISPTPIRHNPFASRTFSFMLNLHNLIKFRSVGLPATCHEAYFNNKTRNNILTISVVLCTRHYLPNILKKSTTHESWQKYYENFPTNWVRSVKGVSPSWMERILIYGTIRMKNRVLPCSAAPPAAEPSSRKSFSFNLFPTIFHSCDLSHMLYPNITLID